LVVVVDGGLEFGGLFILELFDGLGLGLVEEEYVFFLLGVFGVFYGMFVGGLEGIDIERFHGGGVEETVGLFFTAEGFCGTLAIVVLTFVADVLLFVDFDGVGDGVGVV
jgi:hypothetical protein